MRAVGGDEGSIADPPLYAGVGADMLGANLDLDSGGPRGRGAEPGPSGKRSEDPRLLPRGDRDGIVSKWHVRTSFLAPVKVENVPSAIRLLAGCWSGTVRSRYCHIQQPPFARSLPGELERVAGKTASTPRVCHTTPVLVA